MNKRLRFNLQSWWRAAQTLEIIRSSPPSRKPSATICLALGGWEMIPFGIFTFYIARSQSQAAALGAILMAVCALSVYVVNRVAGTRVGGLFG